MRTRDTFGDRVFVTICYIVVIFCVFIAIYPLWLVLIYSISDSQYVNSGDIWLLPKGISLKGYAEVLSKPALLRGYWNTITQTLVGTALNMVLTIPAAYALSKKQLPGRGFFMTLILITMFFSGGLIPAFINMKNLGLLNTWWAIPLSTAVSTYNLIVARTFFSSGVPHDLEEAAEIDGCSMAGVFFRIVLPLSKAMLGVILLYYVVAHWNNYTSALYYTPNTTDYWPLQMVLRNIVQNLKLAENLDPEQLVEYAEMYNQIKYAVIVVSSVPVLVLYPFLQKYFDKGVMLGSVKG